ncbi:putative DNA polymerase III, delta subunit [uncultured Paludibacter sp.]|uniref:Putative DNA polymerase III, delta subunit n=1 Tax=uncultured Paludibacter sp. TaxID=497635 RepID=A0A653AFP9_9BACT|nr:putative DNA polymerase III, delta subunit [uncultured Paludibacter sp.]
MFRDVIGQQAIKERLICPAIDNRIPHAQLLYGQEGVGKLALALAFAQYVMCEHPIQSDACGICPSCVKFQKMQHPDLHFVFPIIKPPSKNTVVCDDFVQEFREMLIESPYFSVQDWYEVIGDGAKQGAIYANESAEIIRKLSLKTYESEYKVMIIWLPELMNDSCANKLLKILEEPPSKTLFLLISNTIEGNIATILSRTQHIHVPRLSEEEIVKALMEANPNAQLIDTQNAARIAEGSYLQAKKILEQSRESRVNFERFVELMRKAWLVGNKRDYDALLMLRAWADNLSSNDLGRERQKTFLQYAQNMVRENFIFNLKQADLNYMTNYETDFSLKFSPFINERNVEDLMNEFALAERHIEQNTYAKMVFFDLALKTIMLLKK